MKELIGFFGAKLSGEQSSDYIAFIEDFYNNAPNGYHSLDVDGYYLKVNDTELRLLGYTREELVGKVRFIDLMPTELKDESAKIYEKFKKEGTARNLEFELLTKDGRVIPILLNANAIYDEEGNFITTHSMIIDISERKNLEKVLLAQNQELNRLNEQLFHINQEKNRFIGIASHDLQNPLTNIKLIAGKFRKTAQNLSDSQRRWIDELVNTTDRMASLIKNMLSINRIERDTVNPDFEQHNIVELLTTSLSRFEEIATRKQIKIHFESDSDSLIANTDPDYLTEIIENLVSNAIKFSYNNTSIWVSLSQNSEQLTLQVTDQGQGILEEEKTLLFRRFQKLSAKPTSNESSTGLGLSIVKELTEQLGGTISCESKVGIGTAFIVHLPL
ncbi:PAS domain-containing sensor histidine kinase [Flectobacillus major]|uniref:PAS domain-containing sensor histidine kinase n=1 Tax=Flectobacillus major TaxID=103 RepID=UPI000414D99C|nr:PAS domain-containing sensor histidine kinase [Flectobacillus major]